MVTSNGSSAISEDAVSSLDKIKRQLALGSGKNLLQGPLLKRSETLRIWNERWVILDPTTGKMEYKMRRSDVVIKGSIMFDSTSTITLSPLNFHGLPKYEGCCFYIGTPQKKEYFICAETPGAARAWVSTLHASQLVLRAHKEAVNSLSGNSSTQMGTVATVLAAANSAAFEATKEIEAAMRISMRATLATMTKKSKDVVMMNDLEVMKKTLHYAGRSGNWNHGGRSYGGGGRGRGRSFNRDRDGQQNSYGNFNQEKSFGGEQSSNGFGGKSRRAGWSTEKGILECPKSRSDWSLSSWGKDSGSIGKDAGTNQDNSFKGSMGPPKSDVEWQSNSWGKDKDKNEGATSVSKSDWSSSGSWGGKDNSNKGSMGPPRSDGEWHSNSWEKGSSSGEKKEMKDAWIEGKTRSQGGEKSYGGVGDT